MKTCYLFPRILIKDCYILFNPNGVSDGTYYKWKSRNGGLDASNLKRLRELESENSQLKRMFADLSL